MPALLEAWFPGVQAGNSVADVVFGKVNPGGKLPVSFPRRVGQVPIYYNHEPNGRPCDPGVKWNSRYRDIKSCDPQYVFGYGLSYSQFEITNLRLSRTSVSSSGSLTASVDVRNVAGPKGDEVVQLYLDEPLGSDPRPLRTLRGFRRVTVPPGTAVNVTLPIPAEAAARAEAANGGTLVVHVGRSADPRDQRAIEI